MNFKLYFKNYIFHFLSIISKVGTLLIITPLISKEKDYFSIYSYGITLLAFLNYADLGFFRAAQKFASESVLIKDNESIYKSIGFGTFISICIVILISIIFFIFSVNPTLAINYIETNRQLNFAKYFFLITSLATPLVVFQRMALSYYEINLRAYRFYIYSILMNFIILGSCSILIFFNHFSLIYYFFLLQLFNLLFLVFIFLDLKHTFKYDLKSIFFNIRFSKIEYKKSKNIALSSLASMISWLIFYEIDIVILSKIFKIDQVASYSLSLIVLGLFRTLAGIIFGSFSIRINHLIGIKDDLGFVNYSKSFLFITAPIIMYLTLTYITISDFFILNWVGSSYNQSSNISKFLVIGYSLSFVSYITSSMLLAKQRVNESFYISISQPVIFWILVFLLRNDNEIIIVAVIKCLILLITDIIYMKYLLELSKINYKEIFIRIFYPFLILSPVLILSLSLFVNSIPNMSKYFNLLNLALFSTVIIPVVIFAHYWLAKINLSFIKIELYKCK
jgi:O-antigen/teichoic acid export membrane protein